MRVTTITVLTLLALAGCEAQAPLALRMEGLRQAQEAGVVSLALTILDGEDKEGHFLSCAQFMGDQTRLDPLDPSLTILGRNGEMNIQGSAEVTFPELPVGTVMVVVEGYGEARSLGREIARGCLGAIRVKGGETASETITLIPW